MKHLFSKEYELRTSAKFIFPYLSTVDGLEQWFADSANYVSIGQSSESVINLNWDDTDHKATFASIKLNKHVKIEFLGTATIEDPRLNSIDFKLETNPITNSVFLKVSDFSMNTDNQDLEELWDGLIHSLKDKTGA